MGESKALCALTKVDNLERLRESRLISESISRIWSFGVIRRFLMAITSEGVGV
jgi:hypothetical protein